MSFGYGFFIEMEDLFNIRAKATGLSTEEFRGKNIIQIKIIKI